VPAKKLREETMKLARSIEAKSMAAVRYSKEAVRSVRGMTMEQAVDYLNSKSDALKHIDPEKSREKAMKMFLDDKSFKPGLGDFKRA
jgi:trans-feruloyl-CoA hydratase/vanillin synthase